MIGLEITIFDWKLGLVSLVSSRKSNEELENNQKKRDLPLDIVEINWRQISEDKIANRYILIKDQDEELYSLNFSISTVTKSTPQCLFNCKIIFHFRIIEYL